VVGSGGGFVSGGRGVVGLEFGVLGFALIGDLSNISVVTVGGICHMLGSTIGKSNGVRSGGVTSSILGLSSVEGSL